jgi:hypothetical protein
MPVDDLGRKPIIFVKQEQLNIHFLQAALATPSFLSTIVLVLYLLIMFF